MNNLNLRSTYKPETRPIDTPSCGELNLSNNKTLSAGDKIEARPKDNSSLPSLYYVAHNKKQRIFINTTIDNPSQIISSQEYLQKFVFDTQKIDAVVHSDSFQALAPEIPKNLVEIVFTQSQTSLRLGKLPPTVSNYTPSCYVPPPILDINFTKEETNETYATISYDPFAYFIVNTDNTNKTVHHLSPDRLLFHEMVHVLGLIENSDEFCNRSRTYASYPNYTSMEEERTVKLDSIYGSLTGYQMRTAHGDFTGFVIPVTPENVTCVNSTNLPPFNNSDALMSYAVNFSLYESDDNSQHSRSNTILPAAIGGGVGGLAVIVLGLTAFKFFKAKNQETHS